ncbi:hypothetical protein ACIBF5_26355 [Micromonospora sp. NPDC050417]|uniref:hypothetical protein n=1 Tax=Micromonospora sp. NPDC050417 TaxID=3364280 RepID=UPI0037AF0516
MQLQNDEPTSDKPDISVAPPRELSPDPPPLTVVAVGVYGQHIYDRCRRTINLPA